MAGAFQTSRELFDNPIWKNIVEFRLFFLIYGKAVYSEEGVRLADDLILMRGEWCRSTRKLQEDLTYIENRQIKTYSTSVIHRAIVSLVKAQRLCTRKHELGTVFTVLNYQQYQGFDNYKNSNLERNLEQSGNSVGTVEEQSGNNNKKLNKDNKVDKEEIKNIFAFWNSLSIVKHRELTKKMNSAINARLAARTEKEITDAMQNYQTVLNGDIYWWTYKFTLDKFMEPKNLDQFLSDNSPFENFIKTKGGGNSGKYGTSNGGYSEATRKAASRGAENFIGSPGSKSESGLSTEEIRRFVNNFE